MRINVIGCGESAKLWNGKGIAIGVNDVFRYHPTNYLIIVNGINKFTHERLQVIKNSTPEKVFIHSNAWKSVFPKAELIKPQSFTGRLVKGKIYSSKTSPFVAISMAYNMDATEIVLYGVDFKDHKHYSPGKDHFKSEMNAYKSFIEALEGKGVKVYQGVEGSSLDLPVLKMEMA